MLNDISAPAGGSWRSSPTWPRCASASTLDWRWSPRAPAALPGWFRV